MMNARLVGGTVALGAVSLIAIAFVNGMAPRSIVGAPKLHMSAISYDRAAPQTKFGIKEALLPSSPSDAAAQAAAAASEAAEAASDAAQAAPATLPRDGQSPAAIIPGQPKIAYTYAYGYQLSADAIPGLERRHADLCEQQGPQVCRILSLEQAGEQDGDGGGKLELAVAAPRARAFGAELAKAVSAAGGKEIASSISGEDLSKDIVDTEARLRARTVLRDRLMEVLATRRGTVAELIEAERGVADVNQEIDEARSWLNEMQGRVEFSRVTITYGTTAPLRSGFLDPIRGTFAALGGILGQTLALLIGLAAVFLPLGAVGWIGRRLWLRFRPRALVPVDA